MVSGEQLRITITRSSHTIVVTLVGDLDVYAGEVARAHLAEALDRAVSHSVARVSIDASGLEFCDSTGLAIITQARADARRRNVSLVVTNLSLQLHELLRLTGLDSLVDDDNEHDRP